jgi:RND superfamily putative drug exporter
MNSFLTSPARTLTSKRGSWLVLGGVVVLVALIFGLLSGAGEDRANETAPTDSESTQAQQTLDKFPGADKQSVMVVASHTDGSALTANDQAELKKLGGSLGKSVGDEAGETVTGPILSDDKQAALLMVPIKVGLTNSDTADTVDDLRTAIDDDPTATGLTDHGMSLLVTGGPAIGADIASAFNGADFTLLIVTIVIVALLLIITYRSPILWLLPLIVIGTADGLASTVTAAVGDWLNLQFDAGIISVLVFGAGANYALLLISRYREELRRFSDHRTALAEAWTHTATTILASNLTVVLSLLSLVFAIIPGTRGLGITAAVGLLISAAAVLFALPPVLAICGKARLLALRPEKAAKTSTTPAEAAPHSARELGDRAAGTKDRATSATALDLAHHRHSPWRADPGATSVRESSSSASWPPASSGPRSDSTRPRSSGSSPNRRRASTFCPSISRPANRSRSGSSPNTDHADRVVDSVSDMDGVVRASAIDDTTIDGTSVTKIMVTGVYEPDSAKGLDLVEDIRTDVHAIDGADAQVGGAAATELDARDGNQQDFVTIVPMVLAISFIILLGILRAPLAAVTLLVVNVVSSAAAIGLGAFLSRTIFGQSALDAQVPILAFLFLVALGIDYSIFLAHRAKKESVLHGGRQGMIEAVAHTGGVITSAGIVLAGVFAALGMLPLMVLGQLGLIVGVGVLVDTILVRTIIVPAIFGLVGDRMWWPNRQITHGSTDKLAADQAQNEQSTQLQAH